MTAPGESVSRSLVAASWMVLGLLSLLVVGLPTGASLAATETIIGATSFDYDPVIAVYDATANPAPATVGGGPGEVGRSGASVGASGLARASAAVFSAPRWADDALAACRTNSFVPGTLVLMANGTTKAIEDVDIGDWVWATDPESGDAGPKRVTDTIVGDGTKQLVDIEVDGATITATDGHPFWVDDQGAWIDADDLAPGDLLVLADGTTVDVDAVAERSGVLTVHNLTVDGVHTYRVMAGDDPVLVHNCSVGLRSTPSGLKTHGDLPSRDALRRATGDELDHLTDVLRQSIDTRHSQMLDPRWMDDPFRRGHALRLEEERQLLRFIESIR